VAYCLFIVWYTILSRRPTNNHKVQWELFWSYREMLTGNPSWKKDVLQNLQNIAFFIPFGLLLPLKKWKAVLITAVVFSGLIEIVQYIGGFGLAELDDVICNTLGTMIGFWIFAGLKKVRSIDET
jgi:glycopeptide antibiotics resistance protein